MIKLILMIHIIKIKRKTVIGFIKIHKFLLQCNQMNKQTLTM
jgi:hypothetical protein